MYLTDLKCDTRHNYISTVSQNLPSTLSTRWMAVRSKVLRLEEKN
jgi:hypothetical protein